MDEETQRKVEETVMEILKSADMEETTEYKVRSLASLKLGLDLSLPDRKKLVRQVVESFLLSQKDDCQEEAGEEEQREEVEGGEERMGQVRKEKEFDDEGDPIICHLSNKRRVTIQDFRGRTLVSIREFYEKDGRQFPSSKGISLTTDQWAAFRNAVPEIEAAIGRLQQ